LDHDRRKKFRAVPGAAPAGRTISTLRWQRNRGRVAGELLPGEEEHVVFLAGADF
jgi:hypothetical protein